MKKISGNSEFKRIKRFYCEEGDLLMASELHLKNNNPITIKDISAKLNVSSVSVHRALSGTDGSLLKKKNMPCGGNFAAG